MKNIFYNNKKSYIFVILFGIAIGCMTFIFNIFPNNDLWVFSSFSTGTIGFWMFSCSVISLLSNKRITAFINVSVYVFLIFLIYYLFKNIKNISLTEIVLTVIYSIIIGIICGGLGVILWNGKLNGFIGLILISLPFAIILSESFVMFFAVFMYKRYLFQAIFDLLLGITYIFILKKEGVWHKRGVIFSIVFFIFFSIIFFIYRFPVILK